MRYSVKRLAIPLVAGFVLLVAGMSLTYTADEKDTGGAKLLKIRVYENNSETPNVLVNVPVKLASAFFRIAASSGWLNAGLNMCDDDDRHGHHLKITGEQIEELWSEIEKMQPGRIVEIQDGGDRVEISIE